MSAASSSRSKRTRKATVRSYPGENDDAPPREKGATVKRSKKAPRPRAPPTVPAPAGPTLLPHVFGTHRTLTLLMDLGGLSLLQLRSCSTSLRGVGSEPLMRNMLRNDYGDAAMDYFEALHADPPADDEPHYKANVWAGDGWIGRWATSPQPTTHYHSPAHHAPPPPRPV